MLGVHINRRRSWRPLTGKRQSNFSVADGGLSRERTNQPLEASDVRRYYWTPHSEHIPMSSGVTFEAQT